MPLAIRSEGLLTSDAASDQIELFVIQIVCDVAKNNSTAARLVENIMCSREAILVTSQ